ncbi:DUF742 domain-containing protein [Streptomyces sp. NPDC006733]|uniref:DUF742 domain-containing protein n=1 Tax=Streptomyces sp. NPDC006733 TaxID=3155460 RepID=UPI00340F9881
MTDHSGPSDECSTVRPFAIVAGRTRPAQGDFDLISLISSRPPRDGVPTGSPEGKDILTLCQTRPLSVAEIASDLGLPLGVIRVLLGDLLDAGYICVTHPTPTLWLNDQNVLREVANALRAL